MSQFPRWYRRELLINKVLPKDGRALDLMDQQDYSNRMKAVEIKLDQQDSEYRRQQDSKVRDLLRQL